VFVLDTDHLGILQRRSQPEFDNLMFRMQGHKPDDFFVAVISFHEQVMGWNAYINRARDTQGIIRGYAMFQSVLLDFASMNVLPFNDDAAHIFTDLRKSGIRINTMDLRIGAIALANGYVMLTRNRIDFEKIPGLRVEDWTSSRRPR
jgi:tRNA(fMet)-specific endonuclease VapC